MVKKGEKLTREHRGKIGQGNKKAYKEGRRKVIKPTHWRGKKFNKKHKENLSKAHTGKKKPWALCKCGGWNKGKKMSEETRKKMSESNKREKSYLWKGGITPINAEIRNGIEFRLWREAVFARDNWTCQKYGIKGIKLHPHHIQNFAQFPELRFAIDNGITLSEKSHKEFHKKYGRKNNTKKQLEEYLK